MIASSDASAKSIAETILVMKSTFSAPRFV